MKTNAIGRLRAVSTRFNEVYPHVDVYFHRGDPEEGIRTLRWMAHEKVGRVAHRLRELYPERTTIAREDGLGWIIQIPSNAGHNVGS